MKRRWRLAQIAYCTVAGIVFAFGLRTLMGDWHTLDHWLGAVVLSPLAAPLGTAWELNFVLGLLFWPVWLAVAVLHFVRPSLAAPLALSLWTSLGYLHVVEGVDGIMSV